MTEPRVVLGYAVALGTLWLAAARVHADPPAARARDERRLAITADDATDVAIVNKSAAKGGKHVASQLSPQRKQREAAQVAALLRERQGLVRERRAQAIALLTQFVAEEPVHAAELPDALMRLAELRWEEARARQLVEFEAWQKLPAAARGKDAPVVDVNSALELYDRILGQYPEFERIDAVLYMKAYALLEASRMGEALTCYKRILEDFPGSRFEPDAHMAFAESFFGQQDFVAALSHYHAVMSHSESELADLSLFKSAWCLWKLGRLSEAARRFREVLDLSTKLASATAERKRRVSELQDEALSYLIQVFTEDERNSAGDLHRFLVGIGGERYAERMLRRLSQTFYDQARYARAIEAYRMLLASAPDDPTAPESLRTIAAAYAALEDSPHTLATYLELAKNYGEGSAWARKQADPARVREAVHAGERALRRQALHYHQRAQKEGQRSDFEHAAELYRAHLEAFPSSAQRDDVAFYLAEILFHRLGQPVAAGELYLRAAQGQPNGSFSKDALYNAIVAFEAVRGQELASCHPGKTTEACAENATDHKFADAVALYVQRYPSDPELPAILFRQGRLYFDRGVYDPAIRQFGQLLDNYPTSEYAATAGELVLESFHRARDFGNIERWARKLKGAPAFRAPESQAKLDALIVQAVWKRGEQLAQKGDHAAAAEAYMRATAEFPRDPRAAQALYNAGQEWQRAGRVEAASRAYDALIERHPGSSEGALGAWAGAQMFESIAQFQDAARYYEAYAETFPAAPKREDAYYNALVLRVAAADHERAVQDGLAYLQAYPSGASASEVYLLVGKSYEAAARYHDAAETYRRYLRAEKQLERSVEAQTRLGKALSAEGDAAAADKAFGLAAKAGRKASSPGARYYAAQARFEQGDRALAQFERVQIAGDAAGLRKRLGQKSELLRKAAQIYADVAEYRVAEWAAAALYKIGQSYELFAESLRNAPMPPNLQPNEEQTYRDELAKFIVPIEERALEAYENGYRKALELRVFNTWTQKQREALTRLNDVEYPPLREAGAGLAEVEPLQPPPPLDSLRRIAAPAENAPSTPAASQAAPAASGSKPPQRPAAATPKRAPKPAPSPVRAGAAAGARIP